MTYITKQQNFKMWNKLIKIGLEKSDSVDPRIHIITNKLCVIFVFFMSILLPIISPNGLTISLVCHLLALVIFLVVFALNYFGQSLYSRPFLAFVLPLTVFLPHILLYNILKYEQFEFYYILLFYSFTSLLIFDTIKEKKWIFLAFIYYSLIILFFDFLLPNFIDISKQNGVYNPSFIAFKTKQFGVFFIFWILYWLKSTLYLNAEQEIIDSKSKLKAENNKNITLRFELEEKTKRLEENISLISKVNANLRANNIVLMKLSTSVNIKAGDFEKSMIEISEILYNTLDISRVSMWAYDKFQNILIPFHVISSDNKKNADLPILEMQNYPLYFNAINSEKIIPAINAESNPSTYEFRASYLEPYNIKSMLDVPFYIEGLLGGIICCENQNKIKNWSIEDEKLVKSMADFMSLAYDSGQRKSIENKIKWQNEEIAKQNEELKVQQEYIQNINVELEKKVEIRTKELFEKNLILEKYSYANSHNVRGPLSRILGLIEVFKINNVAMPTEELMLHIQNSATELDKIIHDLNDILTFESKPE